MSFYRIVLAAIAAFGLSSVALADDSTTTTTTTTQQTASDSQATPTQDKVNINTASAKDLAKVQGLSMRKAKAIVSYRKKHGDFKSLDDLKQVSGFKKMDDAALQSIQNQLTTG